MVKLVSNLDWLERIAGLSRRLSDGQVATSASRTPAFDKRPLGHRPAERTLLPTAAALGSALPSLARQPVFPSRCPSLTPSEARARVRGP